MAVEVLPALLLVVVAWTDRSPPVTGQSFGAPPESDTATAVRRHRTSRDMAEDRVNWQGLDLSAEPKTTGHRWSSEEYHTLSSLTSRDDDGDGDDDGRRPPTRSTDDRSLKETDGGEPEPVYPALTTESPGAYFGRNKYTGGGRYYHLLSAGKEPVEDVVVDGGDQIPEYTAVPSVIPIPVPRWNR